MSQLNQHDSYTHTVYFIIGGTQAEMPIHSMYLWRASWFTVDTIMLLVE